VFAAGLFRKPSFENDRLLPMRSSARVVARCLTFVHQAPKVGAQTSFEEAAMNIDQIRGKWEELKGRFKKTHGAATGDQFERLEGKAEEIGGRLHKGAGDVAEEFRREERKEPV
jgi:uncharacterized protein YjbJ (UPF0337 family)